MPYSIYDHERREIYKFGVAEENNGDGSDRPRSQVSAWNRLVGVVRFTFRILRKAIKGRAKAYEAEDSAVDRFVEKRGRPPVGNDPHAYHSKK